MSISPLTSRVASVSWENGSLTAWGVGGVVQPMGVWLWSLSRCLFSFHCCTFQILGYFDYAFTAIFTVEILLKVMAFSLILTYSKAAVAIIVAILCLRSRC